MEAASNTLPCHVGIPVIASVPASWQQRLLEKTVAELDFSPPRMSKRLSAAKSSVISEEREDRF
jgi:hypothetical protein